MTTYQSGDTVRLQATFSTFAGVVADLSANPTLKIYDYAGTLVTTISASSLTHPSTGVYYYDYTLPAVVESTIHVGRLSDTYIYEFSGTVESTTILRRGTIVVTFV